MARPSKLDVDRQARIVDYLKRGVTQDAAAHACGISARTLFAWKARGQAALDALNLAEGDEADDTEVPDEERPFVQFLRAVDTARSEAEALFTLIITQAARTDPKWAAWWLDRAHPERWAQRQQVSVQQEGEVRIVFEDL